MLPIQVFIERHTKFGISLPPHVQTHVAMQESQFQYENGFSPELQTAWKVKALKAQKSEGMPITNLRLTIFFSDQSCDFQTRDNHY